MNPHTPTGSTNDETRAAEAPSDALPAILLVEDDPTTRAYLIELLRSVPAEADAVASVTRAMRQAQTRRYALWLIDANLPDGTGADLIGRLRTAFPHTPAIAHTAARDRSELQPLLAAGFDDVLVKPPDTQQWLATIRGRLRLPQSSPPLIPGPAVLPAPDALPLWDDAAAARALGGDPANIRTLRELFLAELPGQLNAIESGDAQTRQQQLHRLRASCAFVGASRLESTARQLQDTADADTSRVFLQVARATLENAPA